MRWWLRTIALVALAAGFVFDVVVSVAGLHLLGAPLPLWATCVIALAFVVVITIFLRRFRARRPRQ
jgi:hypothetical protein